MNKAIFSLLIAGFLSACSPQPASQEKTLYVSILPMRSLVKEIVGEDFRIEVLVPPGASPETFEPTPRQFIGLNEAQLVFNVGLLEFETALLDKIEDRTKIVDLSRGIVRIEGSCAHAGRNGSDHAHGVDPHVWTSPRALQRMAENAYEAIHARWPDSAKYTANHARLQEELRQLDLRTAEKIARSGIRYFIIYHPALTYYARDYGLRQEAVEADGKEPSAKRLTALIRQARKDGIGRILYQNQFPVSVVETIARDIGAECTEIDPLREDAIANIDSITDLIVRPQ
ncbi:metal ABC transporter solute-binding protein, Zn/Mn family [Alistipes dispar]|uniref:metal ABC transporter solute-binding protein, Zn/Mn family n=1 Tax=Alistipes dispar TaxID=2585119 RepID=UPI003A86D83A